MVVRAVGQKQATDFLRTVISGIEVHKNGTIAIADAQQYSTGNQKYFAGGDCVNGGKEVVDAVAEGMAAARGIDALARRRRDRPAQGELAAHGNSRNTQ